MHAIDNFSVTLCCSKSFYLYAYSTLTDAVLPSSTLIEALEDDGSKLALKVAGFEVVSIVTSKTDSMYGVCVCGVCVLPFPLVSNRSAMVQRSPTGLGTGWCGCHCCNDLWYQAIVVEQVLVGLGG